MTAFGLQDAALTVGGLTPSNVSCVEEYNGTAHSVVTPLINATNSLAGAGTTNSGIVFGGNPANGRTEVFNGTSWSAERTMATPRGSLCAAGASSAAASAFGGLTPSYVNNTELFSAFCSTTFCSQIGAWSSAAGMIIPRYALTGTGVTNAALAAGGNQGGSSGCTEEYNGTSWSAQNSMSTGRNYLSSNGSQDAATVIGGYNPGSTNATEEYDGTNWTTGGNLNTARGFLGATGTQNAGLAIGGYNGTPRSCVEEYNGSAWTTVNSRITATFSPSVGGTQNASFSATGGTPTRVNTTEVYDGTNWATSASTVGPARYEGCGAGSQSAGIIFGGAPSDGANNTAVTEEFNNTSWSITSPMSTARKTFGSALNGTQQSSLVFANREASPSNATQNITEEYTYGTACISAWSAGGNLIAARCAAGGAGTQNSALAFGGRPPDNNQTTEEYNGSTWAAGGALITGRMQLASLGTQNAALGAGGLPGSSCTEEYDGTSWTAGGALSIAKCY